MSEYVGERVSVEIHHTKMQANRASPSYVMFFLISWEVLLYISQPVEILHSSGFRIQDSGLVCQLQPSQCRRCCLFLILGNHFLAWSSLASTTPSSNRHHYRIQNPGSRWHLEAEVWNAVANHPAAALLAQLAPQCHIEALDFIHELRQSDDVSLDRCTRPVGSERADDVVWHGQGTGVLAVPDVNRTIQDNTCVYCEAWGVYRNQRVVTLDGYIGWFRLTHARWIK